MFITPTRKTRKSPKISFLGNRFVVFFVFVVLHVFVGGQSLQATEVAPVLEGLLRDFSDPANKKDSDATLEAICSQINGLVAEKRFFTAGRWVDQLEAARLGRTFSLYRSPEKQDMDAQLFKIRRFKAEYYETYARFQKDRGLDEEAKAMQKSADRYSGQVKATKQKLSGKSETELVCFEDEVGFLPFPPAFGKPALVPIPTAFFVLIPPCAGVGGPFFSPFTFLSTTGATLDVALHPGWSWSLGNWPELPQSLVCGTSPAGHQLIWVAGPLTGDRQLSFALTAGRWIVSAGYKTVVPDAMPPRRFFEQSSPSTSESLASETWVQPKLPLR